MLNFGAFIAFMGVNNAAFVHRCLRGHWSFRYGVPPLLGFVICAYIWLSAGNPAKIPGSLWLLAGAVYGWWRGSLQAQKISSE